MLMKILSFKIRSQNTQAELFEIYIYGYEVFYIFQNLETPPRACPARYASLIVVFLFAWAQNFETATLIQELIFPPHAVNKLSDVFPLKLASLKFSVMPRRVWKFLGVATKNAGFQTVAKT